MIKIRDRVILRSVCFQTKEIVYFMVGCLLIFPSLFYSGRYNSVMFAMMAVGSIFLQKRRNLSDFAVLFVLGVGTLCHVISFIVNGYGAVSIFNVLILYIPYMLYLSRGFVGSYYRLNIALVYILNLIIDVMFILQIIKHGYTRERVDLLGASINLLASSNILFICLYLYLISVKKKKLIPFAFLVLSTVCVLISLSRSSIIIMGGIFLIYGIYCVVSTGTVKTFMKNAPKYLIIIAFVGILGFYSYTFLLHSSRAFQQAVHSLLFYFERADKVGVGNARNVLWNNAIHTIQNNLIMGTGSSLTVSTAHNPLAAHNFVLEILLLVGSVGMMIYALTYIYIICNCIKRKEKKEIFFIVMLFCVYFGNNLVQPFISTAYFYNALFGWIIIIMSMKQERKSDMYGKEAFYLLHTLSDF